MTRLVAELRASGHDNHRPVHLLNVMGFRAEESPARRRRVPYAANPAASNGRRRVDDWYPIHDWTLAQVWERIATAGTRLHEKYAAGMSRLSCRFCVLSLRADLVCSARLNPDLADHCAEVERSIGQRSHRPHDGRRDRRSTQRRPARADSARRHRLAAIPTRSTLPARDPSLRIRQRRQRNLISFLERGAPRVRVRTNAVRRRATHWRPHRHPTRRPGRPRAAPPNAPAAPHAPAHESSADRLRAAPAPCAACCRTAYQPPRAHTAPQNHSP
jgi:3'-phosphoadenosine 5'-phosphosulfate sulfotransferase (PAPS reductase)/FAD synthetase